MDATTRHRRTVWDRVLLGVLAIVACYGLLLVIAGKHVADLLFDRLGFGLEAAATESSVTIDYLVLVYGVLGSVLVGWMVALAGIAVGPLRRRELWAWRTVTASMLAWFVIDTAFSLVVGFTGHALFNVVFIAAVGAPLAGMRNELTTAALPSSPQSR